MSATDDRRPARALVLSVVGVVVIGVGVVSAVRSVPAEPASAPPTSPSALAPTAARAASSFCAAPTNGAGTTFDDATNTTPAPVRATVTSTAVGGPATQQALTVPAYGTVAVAPPGNHGSTFAFSRGGVAVTQSVAGSLGWSMATCPTSVSGLWLFPSGSTANGDTVDLSLYNPTASSALADVSFLTAGGSLTPQPFQGIDVPPGQLVQERVGDYAQNQSQLATEVSVVSGSLVAEELWTHTNPPTGLTIVTGATRAESSWHFGSITAPQGGTVSFDVANPSPGPVTVTFSAALPSAAVVPRSLTVAGSSTASFSASGTPGWPRQAPFAVSVAATGPVVVGRSVMAPAGAITPGTGTTPGVAGPATRWLVPGLGTSANPAIGGAALRTISVVNPGSAPAQVAVSSLGHPSALARLVVGPDQPAVLSADQLRGAGPFVVTASQPVVVERDDAPSGAPGVVAWPGVPSAG